jgi:hypothetical protein
MEFVQTRDQSSKDVNIINFRVALSTLSSVSFWANTFLFVRGLSADFLHITYIVNITGSREVITLYVYIEMAGGGGVAAPRFAY